MATRKHLLPEEWGDQAAEAVRGLNHATIHPDGYQVASEVDAVIGHLDATVYRMHQAITQAMRWLHAATDAGRIGHDQDHPAGPGVDLPAELEAMDTALLRAAARLEGAREQFEAARRVSAHLTTHIEKER